MEFFGEQAAHGPTVQDYLRHVGLRDVHGSEIGWMIRSFERQLLGTYSPDKPYGSLKMINTLLSPVTPEVRRAHSGEEIFTLTFGGTNVSAALVRINSIGEPEIMKDQNGKALTAKGELTHRVFPTPEELFTEVLSHVDSVATARAIRKIGFVFTFPAPAERTPTGIDVRSAVHQTKDFTFWGIDVAPVGEQLVDFMRRSGKYNVDRIESLVVLNDTPAVVLAKESRVGGIVGTGYNLAVSVNGTLYNIECGGFSDVIEHALVKSIETDDDRGLQLAEKQISGKYLGKQLERSITDLHNQGSLKVRVIPRNKEVDFPAEMISYILDPAEDIPDFRPERFLQGNILADRLNLLKIAMPLRTRSAHLAGIQIATIVHAFPQEFPEDSVTVPIEGSVFWHMPGYKEIVKRVAQELTKKQFNFQKTDHIEAKGAAIAAIGI